MAPTVFTANKNIHNNGDPARRHHARRAGESDRPLLRVHLETLAHRADLLGDLDQLILRQRLAGMSLKQLSRLRGVSVWRMRRRLARLRARLTDPCFLLASRYADTLPPKTRAVGQSYLVEGLTLRACAGRHHMTLHEVRQAMAAVRQMLALAGRVGPPKSPVSCPESSQVAESPL